MDLNACRKCAKETCEKYKRAFVSMELSHFFITVDENGKRRWFANIISVESQYGMEFKVDHNCEVMLDNESEMTLECLHCLPTNFSRYEIDWKYNDKILEHCQVTDECRLYDMHFIKKLYDK